MEESWDYKFSQRGWTGYARILGNYLQWTCCSCDCEAYIDLSDERTQWSKETGRTVKCNCDKIINLKKTGNYPWGLLPGEVLKRADMSLVHPSVGFSDLSVKTNGRKKVMEMRHFSIWLRERRKNDSDERQRCTTLKDKAGIKYIVSNDKVLFRGESEREDLTLAVSKHCITGEVL